MQFLKKMIEPFGLVDKTKQKILSDKGIVKIDFLNPEKIQELKSGIESKLPNWETDFNNLFFISGFLNNRKLKRELHETVMRIIQPELDSIFEYGKCIAAIVMVKGIGQNTQVDLHQDLTICDESKYRSYTLWIPLTDSDKDNGTIEFLHYSHSLFRNIRSQTLKAPFDKIKDFILKKMTTYSAKTGEVLIWDQAGIHYSKPNTSNKARLAVGLTIIGEQTPIQIYHYDNDKESLETYAVPDDFWFRYENLMTEKDHAPSFGKLTGSQSFSIKPDLTKIDAYRWQIKSKWKSFFA